MTWSGPEPFPPILDWAGLVWTGLDCWSSDVLSSLDSTLVPFRSSNIWFRDPPSWVRCLLRVWTEGLQGTGFRSSVGWRTRWMVLSERKRGERGSSRRNPSERERRRPERRLWLRVWTSKLLPTEAPPHPHPPSALRATCSSLAPPSSSLSSTSSFMMPWVEPD